jgi:hypothetical protein
VDLGDQLGEPLVVVCAVAAFVLCADPSAVVGSVADQDSAQQLSAELVAERVDERETLPRWRVVAQRLRRLTEDLVLPTQVSDLALAAA